MRPTGPICVKCGKHMKVKKNGVLAEEMTDFGSYQVWCSDLWEWFGVQICGSVLCANIKFSVDMERNH